MKNHGSMETAIYAILSLIGYMAFLWFVVRPFLFWLVRRKSKENITSSSMFMVFLLLFASAFFAHAVGVHAIFGAFMIGLITPHEKEFAIAITEKIEDLVTLVLIPIYFAYNGLMTDLGNLDDAMAWGIVTLVIITAVFGKIFGTYIAGVFSNIPHRESLTIGVLMNTKGLVEMIILNLGYSEGVINAKIYSIFVVMALFTTFMVYQFIYIIDCPFSCLDLSNENVSYRFQWFRKGRPKQRKTFSRSQY